MIRMEMMRPMPPQMLHLVSPPAAQPLRERSDDGLMALCKSDHRAAFGVLVQRHEARVFGFAARYLGEQALAEEACQLTFVRVWRLRGEYEARGKLTAYLARLCWHACRELGRSRRRRQAAIEKFGSLAPEASIHDPEEVVLQRERQRTVERAIARLPRRLKETVLFRFYHGMSYAQMAEILGRSEATLRSRIHSALKRLRGTLEAAP